MLSHLHHIEKQAVKVASSDMMFMSSVIKNLSPDKKQEVLGRTDCLLTSDTTLTPRKMMLLSTLLLLYVCLLPWEHVYQAVAWQ
jgi:hypothetical protein